MALVFDQRVSGFTFHAAAHGPRTTDHRPQTTDHRQRIVVHFL